MPSDFLEKTLEDIIYENRNIIHTRGFAKLKNNAFRQVILPSGKKIDIFGFEINNGCLSCDIYELKRDIINADAICQAYNYYTELKYATINHFVSFDAKIIMVGRKYEPVSIIDALPIVIEVFTYEYKMDGIRFEKLQNPYIYSEPNQLFSLGLWAFGHEGLRFTEDRNSINFHSTYELYSKGKPELCNKIKANVDYYINSTKLFKSPIITDIEEIKPEPKKLIQIITETFPEQPAWSKEFASEIPHATKLLEDAEIDDCDDEDDELEKDSDFEPDYDAEDCEMNKILLG